MSGAELDGLSPVTRERVRDCLVDLFRYRFVPLAAMNGYYWTERGREGYKPLRRLVDTGLARRVAYGGMCADGRRRRVGDALELTQEGADLVAGELDQKPPDMRDVRVRPERRERQAAAAALQYAFRSAGVPRERILDGREAKRTWDMPDWWQVPLVLDLEPPDPALLVWFGRHVQPELLHGMLASVGAPSQPWAALAVVDDEGEPERVWPEKLDLLGSVHVVLAREARSWGARIGCGSPDWVDLLTDRLAGAKGAVEPSPTQQHPGPLILRRDGGRAAYLCDLRGWDPPRLRAIAEWSGVALPGDPSELWGLVRDAQQGRRIAAVVERSGVRVALVGELDRAIWRNRR